MYIQNYFDSIFDFLICCFLDLLINSFVYLNTFGKKISKITSYSNMENEKDYKNFLVRVAKYVEVNSTSENSTTEGNKDAWLFITNDIIFIS